MSRRTRRERPYAEHVDHLATAARTMTPFHAWTGAIFAIAYAILDHSDAIREHAATSRKDQDR